MYKNLAAAVAAASLVSTALSQGHPAPSSPAGSAPLKAAFVYLTPVLDAGWTRQHDEGRRALQAALGPRVQTRAVDSVPEGPDAKRVLRDLAASGNQLIFTTSFGYTESVMRVARDFPQVKFESVTGFKRADNVATSNARYYEGRYLSGIRSEEHTSELQSQSNLVCRLLLEKKKKDKQRLCSERTRRLTT